MGTLGQLIGGGVGGIIGFLVGGPAGAVAGFSLGYGIGSLFFGPDGPSEPKTTNDFDITTATEGSPVPVVWGKRDVPGNVISFKDLIFDEITESPGKGLSGNEVVVEKRAFANVHMTLAMGFLTQLHGVFDSQRQDWEQLNDQMGGEPLQISTGTGTDFGYAPEATAMIGVTSVWSPRLFLGKNVQSMTPLTFLIEILPDGTVGDPKEGLSTGVNPACVYWTLLTEKQYCRGLDTNLLNLSSFQDAFEIYKAEDRGLNIREDGTTFESMLEALNFHTNSILRAGFDGRLELYPIRSHNYTVIPVAEEEIADIDCQVETWDKVKNTFYATFPDETQNFTQRSVPVQKNEAVIEMTGRQNTETYDFPFFTDLRNAQRRLAELKELKSFPAAIVSMRISKKFHKIRIGDVIGITHSKYGFYGKKFRVLEVQDADFGKVAISIKARLERDPLAVSYTPPIATSSAPTPDPSAGDPADVAGLANHWKHHRAPPLPPLPPFPPPPPTQPPPGSPGGLVPLEPHPGFGGFPHHFWAARKKGTDIMVLIETAHAVEPELPVNRQGRTPSVRWGHAFETLEPIEANDWSYAGSKRLRVRYKGIPGQAFPLQNNDDVDANGFLPDLEHGRWALVVGNTELWLWKAVVPVGGDDYEIEGCIRGANKEYPYAWPAGTPVMIVDTRAPILLPGVEYADWAHRQRYVTSEDYEALDARIRTFFQTVNHHGIAQLPSEGWNDGLGQTWTDRSGPKETASGFYKPDNERHANRGPFPACQAYRVGDGFEYRSWYSADDGVGSTQDWIIEFPPFFDDVTGIGDRVVYDTEQHGGFPFGPPEEPFKDWPVIPTDAAWSSFVGPGTPSVGQRYKCWIMFGGGDPLKDVPVRELVIDLAGSETKWPQFVYTQADQVDDATVNIPDQLWFWVSVQGENGAWARPRLATKIGKYRVQVDPLLEVMPT